MKFEVERTSDIFGHEPPCKEAVLVDDKSAFKTYTMEINSLEELMEFIKKNGEIVITPPHTSSNLYIIEIYDTWRE